MKTYKQFVEGCGCPHSKKKKKTNVAEAVPLLAAPLAIPVGKAIGAGLAATGLTGMIMQARRQGEGKRSQPVDYGQGGTATPGPGRSTQRTHRKDRSAQTAPRLSTHRAAKIHKPTHKIAKSYTYSYENLV